MKQDSRIHDASNAEGVVVNVTKCEPMPRFINGRTCYLAGFGTADEPRTEAFYAYIARRRLPVTAVGNLRMVETDALFEALRADAKVRPPRKKIADMTDEEAFARAGLRRVK